MRGPRNVMKSGPHLPQLEKALAQKRRPNTAKNKYIKINKFILKKNIYYLSFHTSGIWVWFSWVLCFRVSLKTEIKVLAGTTTSQDSAGIRYISKLTPVLVGKIQFLVICWLKATLISFRHRLFQHGSLPHQSEQDKTAREREHQADKSLSFYTLTSEVT